MTTSQPTPTSANESESTMNNLIPKPLSATPGSGAFTLSETTRILVEAENAEVKAIGAYLADKLRPSTGYMLAVAEGGSPAGNISLTTIGGDPSLGEEGYDLAITNDGVQLAAYRPAGLFRGIQTIRQLLPPQIERASGRPGSRMWTIPVGTIHDKPRFAWRGMMLDVARHFFSVADVERLIDLCAFYKINIFHLHLSDDQGWRIEITKWPDLTIKGSRTEVGNGPGGFYTQDDYREIVAYAASRYITIIPEIDMPGHTNAALYSYWNLTCDETPVSPYTGIEVGFSTLCVDKDITYQFIDDVVGELAAITPGPYIHIGGDEAKVTPPEDYRKFIERVQPIITKHGKTMVGWGEIGQAELSGQPVAQHWHIEESGKAIRAAEQGARIVLSPGGRAYLDMQYYEDFPLGLHWAGYVSVEQAYDWEPSTQVEGIPADSIIGVESALWSETITTMADIETMVFPRLPGQAEIGWSAQEGRGWDEYKVRLAAHGPRFDAMGVHFFKAPDVPWE